MSFKSFIFDQIKKISENTMFKSSSLTESAHNYALVKASTSNAVLSYITYQAKQIIFKSTT